LLATTHPWSGIELLLTINLWRGVEFLRSRDAGARNQLSISVVAFVAFLSYYKIWLPTFPQHAELQNVWKLNWSLSWTSAAMAYLPVLIPCALQIRRRLRTGEFNRAEQFLLCALFVAAALAFHDRLITPVQPLHFTRGYVWMPMFLLGLPMIIDWWTAATKKCGPRVVALTVVALLLVVSDNLMFAFVHSHRQFLTQDGFHLDSSERALLQSLHNLPETQGRVLLSSSETLNYLMPTYANVRPWLGHHFNTPSFPDRKATWEGCFEDNRVRVGRIPQDVGVLVIRRSVDDAELAARTDWAAVDLPNVSWAVWRRSTASTF
jgi:hypothetical protein